MMDFFKVTYDGLYMGGVAIVGAESEEEAIELVRAHAKTWRFSDVTVERILVPGSCVLYNDNGDY